MFYLVEVVGLATIFSPKIAVIFRHVGSGAELITLVLVNHLYLYPLTCIIDPRMFSGGVTEGFIPIISFTKYGRPSVVVIISPYCPLNHIVSGRIRVSL